MSRIYAEPQVPTWQASRLAVLPVSPSHSPQSSSNEENFTTKLPQKTSSTRDAFAFTKPGSLPFKDLVSLGSASQTDSGLHTVERVAIVDALGLNVGLKVEEGAGGKMIHPFPLEMDFTRAKEALEDDEDIGMTTSDLEDQLRDGVCPKTASGGLAEKRRMKRFRSANGCD